ncbi:S-layer homology domain-containing protein [Paenibacillus sp. PDC88]|uniref:S-layer homology domain-containing protein n=1 Tax=Paenibacillus sp. PDC88 TaxID=1884375 RepID=UPI00089A22DD|nr:S-layer homology domain-containing protein [Paenibacillus sp. PDC88]SDW66077.1 Cohesin domain-containing protein [Paenibacillus sp. PDC88]
MMMKTPLSKKLATILLASGLILSSYPAAMLAAESTAVTSASNSQSDLPIVRLVPSSYHVKTGDIVEVAIWLQGFTGDYSKVQGYEVHLNFDKALLAPVEGENKLTPSVFKKTSNPMSLLNKVNASGTVQIAEAITSKNAKLFTGYGKVGTVKFRALKAGSAKLTQSKSIIIQPNNPGINIIHRVNHPTITISGNGSGTGKVNEVVETVGDQAEKKVSLPTSKEIISGFKDQSALTKVKWAENAIIRLATSEVLVGTNEGNFEPLRNMTRAEFAKAVVTALQLDMAQTMAPSFSDIQTTDWYYDYVETAASYGLIQGSKDKSGALTFKPNAPITRAELAAILSRHLTTGTSESTVKAAPFTDIQNHWAQSAISYLYNNQLIQGKSQSKFAPNDMANRAEVSVMLNRIQEWTY